MGMGQEGDGDGDRMATKEDPEQQTQHETDPITPGHGRNLAGANLLLIWGATLSGTQGNAQGPLDLLQDLQQLLWNAALLHTAPHRATGPMGEGMGQRGAEGLRGSSVLCAPPERRLE